MMLNYGARPEFPARNSGRCPRSRSQYGHPDAACSSIVYETIGLEQYPARSTNCSDPQTWALRRRGISCPDLSRSIRLFRN